MDDPNRGCKSSREHICPAEQRRLLPFGEHKLVGFDKALAVSSEELAQRFLDALMPTMRRRHGQDVTLSIAHCVHSKKRPLDDVLVMARIEQASFAPNKRPLGT